MEHFIKNIVHFKLFLSISISQINEIPKIPHYDKSGEPYKYDSNGKPTPAILDTYGGVWNL